MAQSIEEPYSLRRLEHRLLTARRSDNMHSPGGGGHVKNGKASTPAGFASQLSRIQFSI